MGRAPCCDKASVKKGPWSPDEDAKLKAYVEEHGGVGNWIALPHKIGLKRCGKSCRLRWLNYLRPNIKHGGFSEAEDELICRLYISIGSRWSIIAAQLPGRTDNDIKNYWNTRLKKKLLGKWHQSRRLIQNHEINTESNKQTAGHDPASSQALSTSALERMQLHMQLQGLYRPFSYFDINPTAWQNPYSLLNKTNLPMQEVEHKMMNSYSSTTSIEGSLDSANILGFQSPVLTSDGVSTDNSSSSFSSSVAGLQSDFCDLLQVNEVCNSIQEWHQIMLEPDNLKEMNTEESISWWPNGLDNNTSPFTWDDGTNYQSDMMLLQDHDLFVESLIQK